MLSCFNIENITFVMNFFYLVANFVRDMKFAQARLSHSNQILCSLSQLFKYT